MPCNQSDAASDITSSSLDARTSSPSPTTNIDSDTDTAATTISHTDDLSEYIPFMSGALHPSDPHPSTIQSHAKFNDSSTICRNFPPSLARNQPFRVITRDQVYEFTQQCFQTPDIIYAYLHEDFLTTMYGLKLAVEAVQEDVKEDGDGDDWDEMLLVEIRYRGGRVRGGWKNVIYPEDIEPEFGEEDQWYEWEYWEKVKEQGRVWEEMGLVDDDYTYAGVWGEGMDRGDEGVEFFRP